MPTVAAERVLLAPREDVWAFLAEPHHLPDWWPGISAVQPDRRGLAPGARWRVTGSTRPSFLRAPNPTGMLVVLDVERLARVAFQLTGERIEAELTLESTAPDRTRVTLTVSGPWLVGLGRSYPRKALARLYDLVQTAAQL